MKFLYTSENKWTLERKSMKDYNENTQVSIRFFIIPVTCTRIVEKYVPSAWI